MDYREAIVAARKTDGVRDQGQHAVGAVNKTKARKACAALCGRWAADQRSDPARQDLSPQNRWVGV